MRNQRNKIKNDPTQEVILYFYITVFPLKNSSTHRMGAIFISRNQISKGCSSNYEVYNSIIYEQNVSITDFVSYVVGRLPCFIKERPYKQV